MNKKGFTLIELLIIFVLFFMIIGIGSGWVMNLIKLAKLDFEPPYKAEIIRGAGILPPVGAITGWLTINDNKTLNPTQTQAPLP